MSDYISRQAAIDAIVNTVSEIGLHDNSEVARYGATFRQHEIIDIIKGIPSAQPEIIRCKDCKFYSPMNRETKTGICNLTMHQNFGDDWFCAGAERREE